MTRKLLLFYSIVVPVYRGDNSGAAIFRAMGNSKVSLKASLISNVINIVGNALCIYGLGYSRGGRSAHADLAHRRRGAHPVAAAQPSLRISLTNWREFRLRPDMVRRILGIGVPNGLESGMFQIGKILVQGLIAALGTVSIAANAVCGTLSALPQIPAQAIGLGMTTVVGQCVGAGDYKQAQTYIKKLTIMATLFHGVLCVLFFFVTPWMLLPLFAFRQKRRRWRPTSSRCTIWLARLLGRSVSPSPTGCAPRAMSSLP